MLIFPFSLFAVAQPPTLAVRRMLPAAALPPLTAIDERYLGNGKQHNNQVTFYFHHGFSASPSADFNFNSPIIESLNHPTPRCRHNATVGSALWHVAKPT
jgi:hypothetical protein